MAVQERNGYISAYCKGMMKVPHLQSHQTCNSRDNLSPRSVLEQRALSGLAIAIDLEDKSTTQENVFLCRFFSKERLHYMIHTSAHDSKIQENGEIRPKQKLNHLETVPIVGLRMVASMNINDDVDNEKTEVLHMKLSSSSSPPVHIVQNFGSHCRSLPETEKHHWVLQHSPEPEGVKIYSAHCSMEENSIFYYANSSPSNISYHGIDGGVMSTQADDFLKLCFFCKCQLVAGKDIYMYRGDQAFCSTECRYQQIANDECKGSSVPS